MIRAVVFDFDGVLVESIETKTNAYACLFECEGEEIVRRVVEYHLKHGGVSRFEKFKFIYREILCRPLSEKNSRLRRAKSKHFTLTRALKPQFFRACGALNQSISPLLER